MKLQIMQGQTQLAALEQNAGGASQMPDENPVEQQQSISNPKKIAYDATKGTPIEQENKPDINSNKEATI